MNEQILFDRLRYIDKLKGAGIGEGQARAHADAIDEALREAVATKSDIATLRSDIAVLKSDLALAMRDMTIRSGAIGAAIVGILATIKYFG
jgi:hypothetical protein